MAQTISRYNSLSYSVNEGLMQSTINDIVFDKNNFYWLSFSNGIQKFEGNNFTDVLFSPACRITGLPSSFNVIMVLFLTAIPRE